MTFSVGRKVSGYRKGYSIFPEEQATNRSV